MKRHKRAKRTPSTQPKRETLHGLEVDPKMLGTINQFAQHILTPEPGSSCRDTDLYHALRHALGIPRCDAATDLRGLWKRCQDRLSHYHPGLTIDARTGLIPDFRLTAPVFIEPTHEPRRSLPTSASEPIDDIDVDVDELIDYLRA